MKKKISFVLFCLSALFALGGTALRVYLTQTAYDAANGFYTNGSLHALLRYAFTGFAVLAFALAHIYIKEEKIGRPIPQDRAMRIAALEVAIAFCGFAIYTLFKILFDRGIAFPVADAFAAAFALLSLPYYFKDGEPNVRRQSRGIFCILSALPLLAIVFGLYFNRSVSYVNHSVNLAFAAAIFTMLATAAEANASIGRSADRRYLSYAPLAFALDMTAAIPDFVFALTDRTAILTDLFYDLLLLTLGIYHFVRMIAVVFRKGTQEN